MRKITLLPEIEASVLGFGCAPILGSADAETSAHALRTAWELGINYFDVAPSYGFGEAEAFLGRFLKGKRDLAIIATKFGIRPHPLTPFVSPLKSIVRRFRRSNPNQFRATSGQSAGRLLQKISITPEAMRRSIERSLTRLQTDYVDVLLLHEPKDRISNLDSVLELSAKLKREGKIRAFGLAAPFEEISEFDSGQINKFDLRQIGIPETKVGFSQLQADRSMCPNVLYGAVRASSCISESHVPVPQLMLELAEKFPKSVLLCSMFQEEHLRGNAASFRLP